MWYNNNMKIKRFKFFKISNLFLALMFVVSAILGAIIFSNLQNNKNILCAVNDLDNETEIYREDGTISTNLWDALKKFYNNNKTNEMPAIKTDEDGAQYLTIDLFKDFPINILNLSGQEIKSIKNLAVFDLSAFVEINLSNNEIYSLGNELSKLDQLQVLNLSKNKLTEFSYTALSNECYTNSLTVLDISENIIENCDVSKINNAEIFANNNIITLEKLVLPENVNVVVWLSNNYIIDPETNNPNLKFGFQGVKDGKNYKIGTNVAFYGLDGLDEITVYSLTKNGEVYDETEVATLSVGQKHEFGIGYYKVTFNENYNDIKFYVLPDAPTLKMFKGEQEIELSHIITSPVKLQIIGEENAKFGVLRTVDGQTQFIEIENPIEITQEGVYNLEVYQYVDGYLSFKTTFYLEYRSPRTMSWVYFILGLGGFILVGYLILKFLPQISHLKIGKNKGDNTKLD